MICKQCGSEYEGKGRSRYCGTACKQLFYRNRMANVTSRIVTKRVTIEPECYDKPVTIAGRDTAIPTAATQHQLTVMERLFYRPANKLKPGQHNFVSLPGRACYGVN